MRWLSLFLSICLALQGLNSAPLQNLKNLEEERAWSTPQQRVAPHHPEAAGLSAQSRISSSQNSGILKDSAKVLGDVFRTFKTYEEALNLISKLNFESEVEKLKGKLVSTELRQDWPQLRVRGQSLVDASGRSLVEFRKWNGRKLLLLVDQKTVSVDLGRLVEPQLKTLFQQVFLETAASVWVTRSYAHVNGEKTLSERAFALVAVIFAVASVSYVATSSGGGSSGLWGRGILTLVSLLLFTYGVKEAFTDQNVQNVSVCEESTLLKITGANGRKIFKTFRMFLCVRNQRC